MATWKKVIVSGSDAHLATVTASAFLGGTFSGSSFTGNGSGLTQITASLLNNALSFSTGLSGSATTYNGSAAISVAVSGASALSTNAVTKWTGIVFANSSLTDNGTAVTGNTSIQLTGANSSLSGSFSGSFFGNGSGLTGVTATAIFPTNLVNDITATDKLFISTSAGNSFISYSALLTDIAGTNLTAGTDDISLATTITGLTSVTSTSFTGSLLGTASFAATASQALTASFLPAGTYQITAATASTISTTATSANANYFVTFVANSSNTTSEILRMDSGLQYNPSTDTLTITGDLIVNGTTTTINTTDLVVEDQFIIVASGSNGVDGGFMVDRGTYASASIAFGWDVATGRFGFQNGLADTTNAINLQTGNATSSAYVGIVLTEADHGATRPTTGEFLQLGAMYVASNQDIWIYS